MTISQTVVLEMLVSGLKVFCDASCSVAAMLHLSSIFLLQPASLLFLQLESPHGPFSFDNQTATSGLPCF
jgi:hypothetical protein